MLKKMILTSSVVLLVLGAATSGFGQMLDTEECFAFSATEGLLSVVVVPDGSGPPLTQVFQASTADGGAGTVVDGTITLIVRTIDAVPIANYPFEDIWLASQDGGMKSCPGGTVADANTDPLGVTTWRYPLRAGGWSEGFTEVYISGQTLTSGPLAMMVNSPDINGDLSVNSDDIGLFMNDYNSPTYSYRSDFNFDGAVNLTDLGYVAAAMGVTCP
jgi:hypothetical protein